MVALRIQVIMQRVFYAGLVCCCLSVTTRGNSITSDDVTNRSKTLQIRQNSNSCLQRRAIVSMMWGHCKPGVLATAAILQQSHTQAQHIVYLDEGPQMKECWNMLEAANVTVKPLPLGDKSLDLPGVIWKRRARKFYLFNLEGFVPGDCIVSLDTDVVPTGNIDEMFDFPSKEFPFWAASDPDPTFQLNSGVMVFQIYENMYEELKATITYTTSKTNQINQENAKVRPEFAKTRFADGDQAYVNFHFAVVKGYHNVLSARYNVIVTQMLTSTRGRSSLLLYTPNDFIKMVHYTSGGLSNRCKCVAFGSCPDTDKIRWRNTGISKAREIITQQCCAVSDLIVALKAKDIVIPAHFRTIEQAFVCPQLRNYHKRQTELHWANENLTHTEN